MADLTILIVLQHYYIMIKRRRLVIAWLGTAGYLLLKCTWYWCFKSVLEVLAGGSYAELSRLRI